MHTLPYALYSAAQTREMDRIVTEQHQISIKTLMSRAGQAALSTLQQHWPQAKKITIFCGCGNNGGDGFELARQAFVHGIQVTVFHIGNNPMGPETTAAKRALAQHDIAISNFDGSIPESDVIVDALLGTGINRDVSADFKAAIEAINNTRHTPVLSLDIPSGLHADTGHVMASAVKATVTLSFMGLNQGLFVGDAPNYIGQICFDSLNVPSHYYSSLKPVAERINLDKLTHLLSPRERIAHKGRYGHLLLVGGDQGMSGAIRIAAEAGARVGAGLISIATHRAHAELLNISRPELMSHRIENPDDLISLLDRATVLTLGPGLGQSDWGQAMYQAVINCGLPMVLDADGLNLLTKHRIHNTDWVLTPHPGEAARLLNCSTSEIQSDRFSAVKKLQEQYGGVIVLKGAGTLVYDGETPIQLSTDGNPGMASGGMGDVLAGVIGGLIAQGLPLMQAACLGVTLHGMAGDLAAKQDGERGMLAMDLMPHLRHLANLHY